MADTDIDKVLANSVMYLELFGHVVVAWLWLKQGLIAQAALDDTGPAGEQRFYRGKLQAMRYFFSVELPHIERWSALLVQGEDTAYGMKDEWF